MHGRGRFCQSVMLAQLLDISAIVWGGLVAGVCVHTYVVDVPLVLSQSKAAASYAVLHRRAIALQQVESVVLASSNVFEEAASVSYLYLASELLGHESLMLQHSTCSLHDVHHARGGKDRHLNLLCSVKGATCDHLHTCIEWERPCILFIVLLSCLRYCMQFAQIGSL